VSTALLILGFTPFDIWPLSLIALIPIIYYFKESQNTRDAIARGIWMSLLFNTVKLYWAIYPLINLSGFSWPVAVGLMLIWGGFSNLQFIALSLGLFLSKTFNASDSKQLKQIGIALILSVIYVTVDESSPTKIFQDTLGYNFLGNSEIRQLAHWGGVSLLGIILFLINFFLSMSIDSWRASRKFSTTLGLAAILLVGSLIAGYGTRVSFLTYRPGERIKVGVVQPDYRDLSHLSAKGIKPSDLIEELIGMSRKLLETPNIDLLVWPEAVVPVIYHTAESRRRTIVDKKIDAFVQEVGIPLVLGIYEKKDESIYNAITFIEPYEIGERQEVKVQRYRKNILIPFGEYIPLIGNTSWAKEKFPNIGAFAVSDEQPIISIKIKSGRKLRIAPLLCYEAIFPRFVNGYHSKSPDVLLNLSNDSWFKDSTEPYQHLALTRMRAVEAGVPLIRSTRTGVSAAINRFGDITDSIGVYKKESQVFSVKISTPESSHLR